MGFDPFLRDYTCGALAALVCVILVYIVLFRKICIFFFEEGNSFSRNWKLYLFIEVLNQLRKYLVRYVID